MMKGIFFFNTGVVDILTLFLMIPLGDMGFTSAFSLLQSNFVSLAFLVRQLLGTLLLFTNEQPHFSCTCAYLESYSFTLLAHYWFMSRRFTLPKIRYTRCPNSLD